MVVQSLNKYFFIFYIPATIVGPIFTTITKNNICRRGGKQLTNKQTNKIISERSEHYKENKMVNSVGEFGVQEEYESSWSQGVCVKDF